MDVVSVMVGVALGALLGALVAWALAVARYGAAASRAEERARLLEDQQRRSEAGGQAMREAFEALAARALTEGREALVREAERMLEAQRAQAQGDLALHKEKVGSLVEPLTRSLGELKATTERIETQRATQYGELSKHLGELTGPIKTLGDRTSRLDEALRGTGFRGKWGELALKNVVELAGLTEHVDFTTQETLDGGGRRPDMLVRLGEGRVIAVDAKAPMNKYLEALAAQDEATQRSLMADHARAVRARVKELTQREYAEHVKGDVDLVVLFLPSDEVLAAAYRADPDLQPAALRARVLVATPTTLVALLRTVSIYWSYRDLASNAEKIGEVARTLYERLAKFDGHLAKVGVSLGKAVETFNAAVGSYQSRVLPMAGRLEELKAVEGAKAAVKGPAALEVAPRAVTTTE